ncbi:hypothetical protein [Marinobacterium marinum]|uniref:Lipoprotein n=1 Tax=Marinobacterium marinum TaxID=2756129 RepID=A0A7W2ABR5_9GAMM|nr:hypothetical protein [Marinobacterium marinum]MBA4501719.1 hypothetical protein [Marinobacterium marinum]
MRFKWMPVLGVIMPLLMSGCAQQSVKSGAAGQLVRGTLSKEGEVYRFSACGSTDVLNAEIASDVLIQEHAAQSLGEGWPVYVEAWAGAGVAPLVLEQPLVIGGSLAACEYTLPGIELRAVSDDGRVIIDLRDHHVRVQYPERLLQLGFERPEVERKAQSRRWQQVMVSGGGHKEHQLSLEVESRACRGKLGAWYALSMDAEVNGVYARGCARLGDLEHWPLRNAYATPDSISTRRLSLTFERDGRFRLVEDYLNNQPVMEHLGRWERVTAAMVRLYPDEQGQPSVSFRLGTGGELVLEGFHPAYGRALELQPTGAMLRVSSGELDWWR